jgi:DNA replication and repair protein RecF
MTIASLGIRSFRNISAVNIQPTAGLNLVAGDNAAGKTSLLEAIYYLGRGRSFRTHRHDRVISAGSDKFQVVAQLQRDSGQPVPLGIERSRARQTLRFNSKDLSSTSELARILPVQLIHPNSHRLLEEGPKYRRQFLDWGVFHVEHRFFPAWQRFQRALKQRNAALRQYGGKIDKAWEIELVEAATIIDAARNAYLLDLQQHLAPYLRPIHGEVSIDISYQRGWEEGQSLSEALETYRETDRKRGHTSKGPQRADIEVRVDGVPAAERLSRGQQKLLVTALLLAQAGRLIEQTGETCIVLIDDLAAELDHNHRHAVIEVLHGMGSQAFITVIDPEPFEEMLAPEDSLFHVEHGMIKKVV